MPQTHIEVVKINRGIKNVKNCAEVDETLQTTQQHTTPRVFTCHETTNLLLRADNAPSRVLH